MRTLFASFRCILPILDHPSAITHQHSATNALLIQHHQVPGIRHWSLVRVTMKCNVMKYAHIRLHLKTDKRPYPYWPFLNQQFHDRLVYIFHQTLSPLLRLRPHCGTNTKQQNCHTDFSTFVITISLYYILTDASIDIYDIACEQYLGIAEVRWELVFINI